MSAIPEHKLAESPNSRSIDIHNWQITASTNPISNTAELDAFYDTLGIPLPEMTFGSNHLTLRHSPSNWEYTFRHPHVLSAVKKGELEEGDGGVKVGYADAWLRSRMGAGSSLSMPATVTTKPYDWTYTTTYCGHETITGSSSGWVNADPSNPSHRIPLDELSKPDPILFYAEIPLFEDELHDNGSSTVVVRIRVMPKCVFVLSRFTLRVDNVLFRIFDTRFYHAFSSNVVVRECSGFEAPYDPVKRQLPRRDDLTPLTDPNFIAKILTSMPQEISQGVGARTKWRGLGTQVQVQTLG